MNKKALILSFLVALLISRIFIFNPNQQIIGDQFDNYEYFGFHHLVKENIRNLKYPLAKTNTLRYPVGFNLSYGYDGVLGVFSGALLGLVFSQPLAYNLSIIIILGFNLYLSYLLFKKISSSFHWGFVGAVIYGLSPYVIARINSHLNLAFIGGFPFLAYSLIIFYEKFKQGKIYLKNYWLTFFAVLTVAFGSLQYLIILLEFSLIAIVFTLFIPKWRKELLKITKFIWKNDIQKLLVAFSLFLTVFLFFFDGYLTALLNGSFVFESKSEVIAKYAQPAIVDYFIPNQYLGQIWSNLNPSAGSIEKVVALGIVEILLFVIIFLKSNYKKNGGLVLAALGLTVLFGLSWVKLPLVPEGGRFIVIFMLIFSIFIVSQKPKLNNYLVLALIAILVLERLSFKIYTSPLPSSKPAEIIKNQPGKAILNIPVSKYNSYYSTLPYFYNKKIVSGYFHYPADNPSASKFIEKSEIIRFICQDENLRQGKIKFSFGDKEKIVNLLKNNDIYTIVLHKRPTDLHKFHYDSCQNVRYQWFSLKPKTVELINTNQQVVSKTIELTNQPNLKVELFAPHDGKLILHGLLIYPSFLRQTQVQLPNKQVINPKWQVNEHGINTSFNPVEEINLKAGQSIYIQSSQELNQTAYVTFYYQFYPEAQSIKAKPLIEEIYKDDNIEVYTLN